MAAAATVGRFPAVARLLGSVRYEVIPTKTIEEKVVASVPRDVTVTVTASPSRGIEATVDLAIRLAGHGFTVVPHVSARLVRDKQHLAELAAHLAKGGYRFCATHGTAVALRVLGHEVEEVSRLGEEAGSGRSVLDAVHSGEVLLVVNTPSPESRPISDAGHIRRAALGEGILCLTSIDTALAAAAALDPALAGQLDEVRSLGEWLEAGTTLAA